jgi:hypothetical protein
MKLKIVLSLVLALALMLISRELSLRKRVFLVIQKGDVRIEHLTVTDKIGPGEVKIEAKITAPSENYSKKLFYKIDDGAYQTVDFMLETIQNPKPNFFTSIPAQEKGKRAYYYIMLEDSLGNKLTLPDKIESVELPFMIKFKGEVPLIVILGHVLGMLTVLFFVFLALFFAIDIFIGKNALKWLAFSISGAFVSVCLGGIVLGGLMTNYTFGGFWEGVPFGWDITDNKTLIILLYWLFMLILAKGTIFKKDEGFNLLKPKSLATFTVIGALLTVLLYLVPHSIRL